MIHNSSSSSGITDISFENRETEERGSQRTVSVYFKMDAEGVKAYRKAAAAMAADGQGDIELSYTPHLGQSRITFGWKTFWGAAGTGNNNFLGASSLLQLPSGKS